MTCLVVGQTRACGDQATDDDVLLQATQVVALAHDGRLGQHPGGFLEGSRRDERVGGQRGLGDAQQDVFIRRRQLAFVVHLVGGIQELAALDLLAHDEVGAARCGDDHATQHLANDHLDVLVVDLHALQSVDVLHLVHDVARQRLDAQQAQDVVRIGRAVHDHLALVDHLTIVHQHVLLFRDQELVGVAVQVGDDQTLLALGVLAERDRTGDLCQHAGILGRTGFEQLGHPRQTPGNVPVLLGFLRDTCQHLADGHLLAIAHGDQRAHREADLHRVIGAGDLHFLARLVDQLHRGTDVLGTRTPPLGIDDHLRGQTGDLVDLLGHGHAFLDVLEAHRTAVLTDDRAGQRIPAGQLRTGGERLTVMDVQRGTVGDLVALALAAVVVGDHHLARTRDDDQLALGVGDVAHGGREAGRTVGLGFHRAGDRRTRSRTTDVEGPHGQLGTRLTDGLGGDDADRFAGVDQHAAAQVATVALGAQAIAHIAGQRGAHAHLVDAQLLNLLDQVLVEQFAGRNGGFLRLGVDHVHSGDTTQHAVAQRLDDLTALDQRTHGHTVAGAAVVLGHHQILRHVHQTTGQITRVGGLQRGVGQTLTSTVGGDEVLQNVQTFAEVRRDRRLDDRAVRLGHQAPHARQLTDLRGRTTGARVGHHVDGVERLLLLHQTFAVDDVLGCQLVHHGLGHLVTGLGPDVHHLVVALALGHQTRGVLLLDLLDLLLGGGQDLRLGRRHQHVVDGDGDATARGQPEAVLHQLVGQDDRGPQTAATERGVDQARDFLLLQRPVHQVERQALGQDLG